MIRAPISLVVVVWRHSCVRGCGPLGSYSRAHVTCRFCCVAPICPWRILIGSLPVATRLARAGEVRQDLMLGRLLPVGRRVMGPSELAQVAPQEQGDGRRVGHRR